MIIDFLYDERELIDLIYQIEKSKDYNSKQINEIIEKTISLIENWYSLYIE
jgi:hypothetical protein